MLSQRAADEVDFVRVVATEVVEGLLVLVEVFEDDVAGAGALFKLLYI